MPITLTQEQEAQVRADAEASGFADAENYLAEQLRHVHEQELFFAANRDELRAMIEEGWEQAERGELMTSEEARLKRDDFKRAFLAKRSAA